MTWIILSESGPGAFTPTGEWFTGTLEETQDHLAALQAESGLCHAAQWAPPET
jgi:hypothetical protein